MMTGSEAIYGFVAWLTSREGEDVIMGSSQICSGIPELITEFCKVNNLSEPRENWPDYLTHPKKVLIG